MASVFTDVLLGICVSGFSLVLIIVSQTMTFRGRGPKH